MFAVKNETSSKADLYIYGRIIDDEIGGSFTFCGEDVDGFQWPAEIRRQLDGLKGKDLTIYINSYGGMVSAGLAMAHIIERHDGRTTAVVDGYCCSIATQIFFAANKRIMSPNSYLMIHKPLCEVWGDANEMRKAADYLDTLQNGIESTYVKNALPDTTAEKIHQMVEEETWLTGADAAKIFDIELKEDRRSAMNCVGSLEKLKTIGAKKIPSALNFIDDKDIPSAPALATVDWTEIEITLALARAKGAI